MPCKVTIAVIQYWIVGGGGEKDSATDVLGDKFNILTWGKKTALCLWPVAPVCKWFSVDRIYFFYRKLLVVPTNQET